MLDKKELEARARKIKLLLMDVDGVLTNGDIFVHADGSETKVFNVQDGHGIALAHRAGLRTGLITGRRSPAVEHRANDLGIAIVHQRSSDKLRDFLRTVAELNVLAEETAFIGDDITDIPPMRRVGLAIAVANAHDNVKQVAHYVTKLEGGKGAVREAIELILKANGSWKSLIEKYVGPKDETSESG